MQIAGNPASTSPACSHCDNGPASSPMRAKLSRSALKESDHGLALAPHLGLANDPAAGVDDADAAPFQGDVDRGIVLHGCPSVLMLGADLRTPFHHHREGQPPLREGRGGGPGPITASLASYHLCGSGSLVDGGPPRGMLTPSRLRIGHSTYVGYGPLFVAQEKGFFRKQGADVDMITIEDVHARIAALEAGQDRRHRRVGGCDGPLLESGR